MRGLESAEVAGLGYELILGNTYHLFVSPGPERIAAAGGLHAFMGWERALITDSGGFQVFSLAHGGVADEVKGSGRPGGEHGSVISIDEEGVRFRSYRDGTELLHLARGLDAGAGGAGQRHRARLRRVHALPRRPRLHGALDRAHPPLARAAASTGTRTRARRARRSSAIVQGGVHEDLRRESAQAVSEAGVDGIAIGGTLGRDKEEMAAVLAMTVPLLPADAAQAPARDRRGRRPPRRDRPRARRLRLRRADPARPPRRRPRARPGEPLPHRPAQGRLGGDREPLVDGCPCPACRNHDRDYLSYLSRAEELTAVRLLCLHNLTYMRELVAAARRAIVAGEFDDYRSNILSGGSPFP